MCHERVIKVMETDSLRRKTRNSHGNYSFPLGSDQKRSVFCASCAESEMNGKEKTWDFPSVCVLSCGEFFYCKKKLAL